MTNKILVTDASRFGSTVGAAEAIEKTMAEQGAQVDVLPLRAVADLSAYQAVVTGRAINVEAWLPEALQFVQAHQDKLRHKPFAAFPVSMTLSMKNGEQYHSHVAAWLDQGKPRAFFAVEEIAYNPDVSAYIRARGQ